MLASFSSTALLLLPLIGSAFAVPAPATTSKAAAKCGPTYETAAITYKGDRLGKSLVLMKNKAGVATGIAVQKPTSATLNEITFLPFGDGYVVTPKGQSNRCFHHSGSSIDIVDCDKVCGHLAPSDACLFDVSCTTCSSTTAGTCSFAPLDAPTQCMIASAPAYGKLSLAKCNDSNPKQHFQITFRSDPATMSA